MIRRVGAESAERVSLWAGVDLSGPVSDPNNVCLVSGNGGAIFVWRGPGVFEGHCFFAERGREAIEVCRAMLRRLVGLHEARLVWAAVPVEDRKVKLFCRWVGFRPGEIRTFAHGECQIFSWEP